MKFSDIPLYRLHNQHLIGDKFKSPEQMVEWFGAVQSQDYPAAKWSVGQRVEGATDATVEEAYNEGRIVRTHVMRPTWHFILPQDVKWMQKHTADRVRQFLAHYDRKLELPPEYIKKTNSIIANSLIDKQYKTRAEIGTILESHKIAARGQRLGHIVCHAELAALICSGPRRSKQFTYALIDDRASHSLTKTREEALATLAHRYIRSHDPVQVRDFAWWAGLTQKDARLAVDSIKSKLISETVEGKEYWLFPTKPPLPLKKPVAHLLSIYDEYVIAYNDRSALGDETIGKKLWSMGAALQSVVTVNGRIVGTWKRKNIKKSVDVKLKLLEERNDTDMSINAAIKIYEGFLDLFT